jgi:hypothetical protein
MQVGTVADSRPTVRYADPVGPGARGRRRDVRRGRGGLARRRRDHLRGVAEKHPGLKISLSHAGGGFPMVLTRAQWFWGRTWNEEPPLPESERPEATLRSMGLSEAELVDDVLWRNAFRFPGIDPPQ